MSSFYNNQAIFKLNVSQKDQEPQETMFLRGRLPP